MHRSYKEVHRAIDRWMLPKVLDECNGIIVHAAKYLGMTPKGLRGRLKRLGLYKLDDGDE